MKRSRWFVLVLTLIGAGTMLAARQASLAESRLQAAITKAVVEKKCEEAIAMYDQVVTTKGVTHQTAAEALLHQGGCFEATGRILEARSVYSQIVSNYGDVKQAATAAASKLRTLPSGANSFRDQAPFTTVHTLEFLEPNNPLDHHLSPNGRYMAYEVWGDDAGKGVYRGFIRDLVTGRDQKYLETNESWFLRWSPDSGRLAVFAREPTAEGFRNEVRLVNPLNGSSQVLGTSISKKYYRATWPAWSPDSRRLAFTFVENTTTPADVQIAAIDTGEVKSLGVSALLTNGLVWSPDGTRVVYLAGGATPPDSSEFRIINVTTHAETPVRVPGNALNAMVLEWLVPQSIRGAVQAPWQVFVTPVGPGQPRMICEYSEPRACGPSVWSVNASIVRDPATKRYVLRDFDGRTERPLTTGSGEEDWLLVSADRKLASFVSNRDGRWSLYVVPLDQVPVQNPLRIATLDRSPNRAGDAAWGANGLLYYGFGGNDSRLIRINVDPRTGQSLGPPATLNTNQTEMDQAAISPDSQQIASWHRNGSSTGLGVMSANGSAERVVLQYQMRNTVGVNPGYKGLPLAWLSSNELMFVDVGPRSGPTGVAKLDLRTGVVTHVGDQNLPDFKFSYLSKTNEIVYSTRSQLGYEGDVRARSLATGAERTIAKAVMSLAGVVAAADGTVAYTKLGNKSKAVPAELHAISPDGADRILLSEGSGSDYGACTLCAQAWSPDGRYLLYRDLTGKLQVLNVQSREHWALTQQSGANWDQAMWSPDGTFIVVHHYQNRDEWKAFEGVTYEAVVAAMKRASGR